MFVGNQKLLYGNQTYSMIFDDRTGAFSIECDFRYPPSISKIIKKWFIQSPLHISFQFIDVLIVIVLIDGVASRKLIFKKLAQFLFKPFIMIFFWSNWKRVSEIGKRAEMPMEETLNLLHC